MVQSNWRIWSGLFHTLEEEALKVDLTVETCHWGRFRAQKSNLGWDMWWAHQRFENDWYEAIGVAEFAHRKLSAIELVKQGIFFSHPFSEFCFLTAAFSSLPSYSTCSTIYLTLWNFQYITLWNFQCILFKARYFELVFSFLLRFIFLKLNSCSNNLPLLPPWPF